MSDDEWEEWRSVFAGIVQGRCENSGDCDDGCPCDEIVDELLAAMDRVNDENTEIKR